MNSKVEPRAINRTTLFTVEGEKDDISGAGGHRQLFLAAHDILRVIAPLPEAAPHGGAGIRRRSVVALFTGKSWQPPIWSIIKSLMLQSY